MKDSASEIVNSTSSFTYRQIMVEAGKMLLKTVPRALEYFKSINIEGEEINCEEIAKESHDF